MSSQCERPFIMLSCCLRIHIAEGRFQNRTPADGDAQEAKAGEGPPDPKILSDPGGPCNSYGLEGPRKPGKFPGGPSKSSLFVRSRGRASEQSTNSDQYFLLRSRGIHNSIICDSKRKYPMGAMS